MDRLPILAGALALSLLAAFAAAAQLVDYFWYGEDLGLFVLPIGGFSLVAVLMFGVAHANAPTSRVFGVVAIALAVVALALAAMPFLAEYVAAQSKNPEVVLRPRSEKIRTVLLVPLLLAIVVQFWFVRRGWLRARGREHRTAWPWITTIVACVLALSPPGLAILGAALAQSATDWLRSLWLIVALAFAGIVLLAGLVEWGIRARKRRGSLASQGP